MKMSSTMIVRWITAGIFILTLILLIKPVKAQEKDDESSSVIKIKLIKEKDGKTVVVDTTIMRKGHNVNEEMEEVLDSLNEALEEMESAMKDMQIDVDIKSNKWFEEDSLIRNVEKMIIVDSDGKTGTIKIHGLPECHGFNYHFNLPDGEFPMEWVGDIPSCIEFEHEGGAPDMHRRSLSRFENGSLNELLGEIPLDRVKKYSVKDRKNGKRIVIDVEDGPFFGSTNNRVIIKGTPRMKHSYMHPKNDVKVIIKDIEEKPSEKKEFQGK